MVVIKTSKAPALVETTVLGLGSRLSVGVSKGIALK